MNRLRIWKSAQPVYAAPCILAVAFALLDPVRLIADDIALLAEIRAAWQARQDHADTLYAEWYDTTDQDTQEAKDFPNGARTEPTRMRLTLDGPKMRLDKTGQRYNTNKKGWYNYETFETFTPATEVRQLMTGGGADQPTGYINRSASVHFTSLATRMLWIAWYRPLDNNLMVMPFEAWQVCHDASHVHPGESIVTIQAEPRKGTLLLLFLDSRFGYLPVGSRFGTAPQPGTPMAEYEESQVEVSPDSTALLPKPLKWVDFHISFGMTFPERANSFIGLEVPFDTSTTSFEIEFPDEINVYDRSEGRTKSPIASATSALPGAVAFPEEPPRARSIGRSYWAAAFFGVLLAATMYRRLRARS